MDVIKSEMRRGRDLEGILESADREEFEGFCALVLDEHGWEVELNLRFKPPEDMRWMLWRGSPAKHSASAENRGMRPGKHAHARYAAEVQRERTEELSRMKAPGSFRSSASDRKAKWPEFHPPS